MHRHSLLRNFFIAISVLLAGSVTAAAVEHADGYHSTDVHHCSVCCTNYCTSAPVQRQTTQLTPQEEPLIAFDLVLLHDQAILDQPVPPPKFLA